MPTGKRPWPVWARTTVLTLALSGCAGWAMGSMLPGVASAHAGRPHESLEAAESLVGTRARVSEERALRSRSNPWVEAIRAADLGGVGLLSPAGARTRARFADAASGKGGVGRPERHTTARFEGTSVRRAVRRAARRDVLAHQVRRAASVVTMTVLATAYWPDPAWSTGYTATGWKAQYGIVAVDPSVIPLGTRMYVPGYGQAIAEDTGGAIVGHRIDLCYDSAAQALDWGVQTVQIRIEQWG